MVIIYNPPPRPIETLPQLYWYKQVHADYYTVAFAMLFSEENQQIREWCYKTYGPQFVWYTDDTKKEKSKSDPNHIWRWEDSIDWGEIDFHHKQDVEWFLLKWS